MRAEISQIYFFNYLLNKMEKVTTKSNKATLIAAALIITGATAIFGTYAAENEQTHKNGPGPLACYQMMEGMTVEQKAALAEARELREAGDFERARAILEEAGIRPPKKPGPRPEFLENLTDEQREMLKEARELMQAGDVEAAKAIFEELGLERPEKRPGNGFGRKPGQRLHPQTNTTE